MPIDDEYRKARATANAVAARVAQEYGAAASDLVMEEIMKAWCAGRDYGYRLAEDDARDAVWQPGPLSAQVFRGSL